MQSIQTHCQKTENEHTCTPIIPVQIWKYKGNNLLCNVPNVLLGKFLIMVIPATKVVYTTVPNHVAKESKWRVAAALGERTRYFPNLRRALVEAVAVVTVEDW